MKKIYWPITLTLFCISWKTQAQLTISGQVRTRTELRNGQGTVQTRDTVPALFTSQRTRLNLGYSGYRYKIFTAIQDVRVWGQDASTINRTTSDVVDGLMLHEAWAEVSLVDTGKVIKNFTLKIGRQELLYDDSRLLGNLDWLQQARRHDAALLKFEHNGWTIHLGGAYNQNAEKKSNTIYNGVPTGYTAGTNGMTTLYKAMQFLYVAKKFNFGNATFLAFKDDFSKYHFAPPDVSKTTPIYERGVWSRHTIGGNMFGTALQKLGFALSTFYQGGSYRDGTSLNEYFFSLATSYAATREFTIGPGVDVTSGNTGSDPTKKNQRFDPLYGTPHKFWGYMDYFYVADGFGANGLVDYYLKGKYKPNEKLLLTLDAHRFVLPSAVRAQDGTVMSKGLGTELDFVLLFAPTKAISLEAGYCTMFSTATMASAKVKNVPNAATLSTWTYAMISIKPSEFVGK